MLVIMHNFLQFLLFVAYISGSYAQFLFEFDTLKCFMKDAAHNSALYDTNDNYYIGGNTYSRHRMYNFDGSTPLPHRYHQTIVCSDEQISSPYERLHRNSFFFSDEIGYNIELRDSRNFNVLGINYFDSAEATINNLNITNTTLQRVSPEAFNKMRDLNKLTISHNPNLKTFVVNSELLKIKTVDISQNSLKTFNFLGNYPLMISLNGSFNQIRYLTDELRHTTALEILDMSFNKIQSITAESFDACVSLVALNLSYNELTELPTGVFKNNAQITWLNLQNNKLHFVITGVFNSLINLKTLVLRSNAIYDIEEHSFAGMFKMNFLDLSQNELTDLKYEYLEYLPMLTSLNISQNFQLSSIDFSVFRNTTALSSLIGGNGNISLLQTNLLSDHLNIISINLTNNLLSGLSQGAVCGLNALEKLDLSNNLIEVLPADFLRKCYNDASNESDTTELLNVQIRQIHLQNNKLVTVPVRAFANFSKLRTLNLENNKILHLNKSMFTGAFNLTWISVNYNCLSNITFLGDLFNLRTIYLRGNVIRDIDGVFDNITLLKSLDLSSNKIEFIAYGTFEQLINLELLNLSSNRLHILQDGLFYFNKKLITLYIDNNTLSSIKINSFFPLNLKFLSMDGNIWSCSELLQMFHSKPEALVIPRGSSTGVHHIHNIACQYNYYKPTDYINSGLLNLLQKLSASRPQLEKLSNFTNYTNSLVGQQMQNANATNIR